MWVYILECSDGKYYTGVTNNLERRIEEHQNGININCFTFNRRPLKLVYNQCFNDFKLAFEFETKIKKWSQAKKKALIEERFEDLIPLSKKKFN